MIMIDSILKRHFANNVEKEKQSGRPARPQQPPMPSPELLEQERIAKEKFIKRAKGKMLGHAICKNEGCQNLRANGNSRCLGCTEKHRNAKV